MTGTRRHPFVAGIAVLAGVIGVWLWISLLTGPWRVVSGLVESADHLRRAEKALTATALKQARYETLAAVAAAHRARAGLEGAGPLFDLARLVPRTRRALQELPHLVRAAELSASAASGTLDVAQNALRGPDKIIVKDQADPEGGAQIRIERVREIGRVISGVRRDIRGVVASLERVEPANLPGRVRPQVADGIAKARKTDALLAKAEAGFEILPAVLGAEGRRTYVIGMQNSAELRGTGGALLQFALLTIEDGKPELLKEASTVYDVDKNRQTYDIPLPPDAWYVRAIEDAQRFGNANWSPDWPLSARLTLRYADATKVPFPDVDGAILVDPIVVQKLMPGIGTFHTEPFGLYITANRVVHLVLYKAYASYPIPKIRRARLRTIVDDFYQHMLKPKHPSSLAEGFGSALRQKHMQIWMADSTEHAFIQRMNWDGAIDSAPGDYLYVVEQNVGGNKLDYFASNTNSVSVQFDGDDAAVSTEVRVRNEVYLPQPIYPMGNTGKTYETNGWHQPMLNVYVPKDARLRFADVEGIRMDAPPVATWSGNRPPQHLERGKTVWSATLRIPPQQEGALNLGYVVPNAVKTEGGRKVYRLTVQRQPRVRPERLLVRVALPRGARQVVAPGFKREGSSLVYDEPLNEDIVLEVSWQV